MKTQTTQTDIHAELATALAAYDTAHKTWFNTSVFTEAHKTAKQIMDQANEAYLAAYRKVFPNHIAF